MTASATAKPTRAAIYVRTAATERLNRSLDDQERRCRAAIALRFPNCLVVDVFRDSGVSGRTANRPGLDALLKYAGESPRPIDIVVVESTDRVARSLAIAFPILDVLHFRGVKVHFVDAPMGFSYQGLLNGVITLFEQASHRTS